MIVKERNKRNKKKNIKRMNCYIYNIYKKSNLFEILFNYICNCCILKVY